MTSLSAFLFCYVSGVPARQTVILHSDTESLNKKEVWGDGVNRVVERKTAKANLVVGGVWRSRSDEAKVYIKSDVNGTCRYRVTATEEPPADLATQGMAGGSVQASTLFPLTLTGLEAGGLYLHMMLVPEDGGVAVSSVLTVPMPYDVYFYDDFDIYNADAYPQHFFQKYNGTGTSKQKILISEQADGKTGGVFRLEGASGWASEQRVLLSPTTQGLVVWEANMKLLSKWGAMMIGQNEGGGWTGGIARINPDLSGFVSLMTSDYGVSLKYDLNLEAGRWYKAKIVTDMSLRKFQCYIDGVLLNPEPLDAHPSYTLDYFGLCAGHGGEVYYDNACFYLSSGVLTGIGSAEHEKAGMSVQALPGSKSFVINFGEEEAERVEVYNLQGLLHSEHKVVSCSGLTLDMSAYASGMYLLKVYTKQGEESFKIMLTP